MKVNIKGLVFTGFAAAILSANAMAAATATNTVTSKSYVDAKVASGETAASIDSTSTLVAPNQKQVSLALATKQDKDATDVYMVGQQGAWQPAYNAVAVDSTYLTKTNDSSTGVATVAIDTTKMTTTGVDSETGQMSLSTSSSKLVSEKAVAEAVTAASNVTNFISQQVGTATNKAPSENAVNQYVTVKGVKVNGTALSPDSNKDVDIPVMTGADSSTAGVAGLVPTSNAGDQDRVLTAGGEWVDKQDLQTDTTHYQVSKDGSWENISSAVSGSAHISTALDTETGGVKVEVSDITNSGADVVDSDTGLTTGKAVYEYVNSVTGGNEIPAQNPLVCTAAHPCALVDEAGTLNWRTMAQANYDGGVCGNANDSCGDSI